jgi:hypothetical protein
VTLRFYVVKQDGFSFSGAFEASPLYGLEEVVHLLLFASAAVVVCFVDCVFGHQHGDLSHACSAGSASYRPEYFLALLNSRLMLYYYYKKFGELEWKSFPYLTQKTIQQLPLRKINFQNPEEKKLHDTLVRKVTRALEAGKKIPDDLDFEIEDLVMKAYQIPEEHRTHIWDELKKIQRLRIIRETFGEDAEEETEKQVPTKVSS